MNVSFANAPPPQSPHTGKASLKFIQMRVVFGGLALGLGVRSGEFFVMRMSSGFISCCHDEISQQHEFQGRKGLFLAHNSWLQPVIAGTSQQLGLERTGQTAATGKSREDCKIACQRPAHPNQHPAHSSPFFSPRLHPCDDAQLQSTSHLS